MTKVKTQDAIFVIDEMVKNMETKDIINMIALEVEKASNKYHKEVQAKRAQRRDDLKKAILAFYEDGATDEVTQVVEETVGELETDSVISDKTLSLLDALDELIQELV